MENIPVTFSLDGEEYKGYFSKVMGAGSTAMFHLNVAGYYWGRLRFCQFSNGWCFDPSPKTQGLEKLADEFEDLIIAWYQ